MSLIWFHRLLSAIFFIIIDTLSSKIDNHGDSYRKRLCKMSFSLNKQNAISAFYGSASACPVLQWPLSPASIFRLPCLSLLTTARKQLPNSSFGTIGGMIHLQGLICLRSFTRLSIINPQSVFVSVCVRECHRITFVQNIYLFA